MASPPPSKPCASDSDAADTSEANNHSTTLQVSNGSSQAFQNEETSKNRDLKRKAGDALFTGVEPEHYGELCMILELPEEVRSLIMSFLAHKKRILLGTTCKSFLETVEAFSGRALNELKKKGDETWETRIRDDSPIKTENPRPLVLPNRYLLWKAYRTHLYTLGPPLGQLRIRSEGVHASPDGKWLVTCESDIDPETSGVCQLWNLETRRCVKSIDLEPHIQESLNGIGRVLLCEDHIVVSFDGSICVWTIDGELVQSADQPEDQGEWIQSMAVGQQKLMFARNASSLSSLDLATGAVQEQVMSWQSFADRFELIVSEGLLLVLRCNMAYGNDPVGIYVYDLKDFSQKHFFPGEYLSFTKANDDPSIIVAACKGNIDIFKLKDGRLSRTARSPCVLNSEPYGFDIMFVARSRVYLRDIKGVQVYSILNGELKHAFNLPARASHASTNGCELFLGFFAPNRRIRQDDGGPRVRAYCFQDY